MPGRAVVNRLAPAIVMALLLASPAPAGAYSVLSHESAIDEAWDRELRPLLLRRFPRSTPADLERARSFAYGGSVIQDLGYYPFGSKFFSNLLHYARTGDFVEALLREAQTVDELAFALGAMAHYANDIAGHPLAVNRSVPLVFPKLRAKFGDKISYVQAPKQHVIVEFSFDVAQAARGRYSFTQYRTLLDFQVATALLARAFRDTYGLDIGDVLANEERAISTYRFAVSQLIPALTEAAWRDKREEILAQVPAADRRHVVFAYTSADYEQTYGKDYQKPAPFARFLAWVYRIVPKVGPLRPLAFKAPTGEVDRLFGDSIARAHARYREMVRQVRDGRLDLSNTNFDTGEPTHANDYALADTTYAEWLDALAKREFTGASPAVRRTIDAYYRDAQPPDPGDRKAWKAWQQAQATRARLDRAAQPVARRRD
jgi:hypothetical protein